MDGYEYIYDDCVLEDDSFNEDISKWNTAKVTTMYRMRDAARHPKASPSRGSFRRL